MKVLDEVGTMQLLDTGRRCSVRDVPILIIRCTKRCCDEELIHGAISDRIWAVTRATKGYHQGCDPTSLWARDPVAAKLQHDTMRSLLDKRPMGSCVACDQLDCTGATA